MPSLLIEAGADAAGFERAGVQPGNLWRLLVWLFPFLIENCSLSVLQRTGSRTVVTAVNDTCHLS